MNKTCMICVGLLVLLISCQEALPSFPEVGEPYAITEGPEDHLLANYFGINAWSPDGRYVCVLGTDFTGRLPEVTDTATVALVDLADSCRYIPIGKTTCWNFQEAAMFHWLRLQRLPGRKVCDGAAELEERGRTHRVAAHQCRGPLGRMGGMSQLRPAPALQAGLWLCRGRAGSAQGGDVAGGGWPVAYQSEDR